MNLFSRKIRNSYLVVFLAPLSPNSIAKLRNVDQSQTDEEHNGDIDCSQNDEFGTNDSSVVSFEKKYQSKAIFREDNKDSSMNSNLLKSLCVEDNRGNDSIIETANRSECFDIKCNQVGHNTKISIPNIPNAINKNRIEPRKKISSSCRVCGLRVRSYRPSLNARTLYSPLQKYSLNQHHLLRLFRICHGRKGGRTKLKHFVQHALMHSDSYRQTNILMFLLKCSVSKKRIVQMK